MRSAGSPLSRTARTSARPFRRLRGAPSTGTPSSPDQVAEALRNGVDTGRYAPGQKLVEADLCAELKVSRGPIREALKRLAAEGIIELYPHRGAYIRQLTRREVSDILVIQESLTGLAARLAAERIAIADHRARFNRAYAGLMAAPGRADSSANLDARVRFYVELVAIGGNRELARFVPIPQTNLLRAQFERHLPARERALRFKDYETIARYILDSKPQAAELAMRRHLRNTRLAIEALPAAVFAKERP